MNRIAALARIGTRALQTLAFAAVATACGARSPLEALIGSTSSGAPTSASDVTNQPSPPRTLRASNIALGPSATCAIISDGTVRCWGYAGAHALGNLPPAQCANQLTSTVSPCVLVPTAVPGLTGVVRLAIGESHGCALAGNGDVRCWGTGQGAGVNDDQTVLDPARPPLIPKSPPILDLAASRGTCARREDASVLCWGRDLYGELGHATRDGFAGAIELAMGHHFTCGRLADGTVECAGSNDAGQLGNGTRSGEESHPTPDRVRGLSDVTQIATGDDHSCAVLSDGAVACWGSSRQVVPWQLTRVDGLADVTQVAAGDGYTCALHSDGTVACWGVNLEGQLGDGTHEFRERPTPVVGLRDVASIRACNNHTCALTRSGDVSCWGLNAHGEIGDGTTTYRATPVRVDL